MNEQFIHFIRRELNYYGGANLGIARNEAKANEVAAQIRALTLDTITVDVFLADMASQQSIRQAAAAIF